STWSLTQFILLGTYSPSSVMPDPPSLPRRRMMPHASPALDEALTWLAGHAHPLGSGCQPGAARPSVANSRSWPRALRLRTSAMTVHTTPNGKPHHPATRLWVSTLR